ncbi:hypothetical protein QBC40DRAFT_80482 [Triangularia verruculosa]|uniref:Uncharacterized protein n=1 Tax=Triangularia verruculosa TaxID=2587418 RepID=A0AAN7AUZ5_9PEZI|nr:hypothetical protein QBC40DRAFT_80482 [Triangularia verruculosa]
MASMEAANARYHNGHQQSQIGGPPLPASPTLTNPDMILPDEVEPTYSPDHDLDGRGHAPLGMWKGTHAAAISVNMQHMFSATSPGGGMGDLSYGLNAPATPTTPIIYGNGTMLSDIGEVTEAESTPGKPSPTRTKGRRATSLTRRAGLDAALRSSPTIGAASAIQKSKIAATTRERRASMESTSTITTEDQAGLFADFDDSASVEDSVFQGDDEESTASSYHEGRLAVDPDRLGVTRMTSMDRLSTYSTTSLSRRAEEILANAKQRLTTMESNLTRARSSLNNNTYGSDGSTPSPPFQRAATTMQPRDAVTIIASGVAAMSNQASGHTRISSDIAMRNGLPYRVAVPRSQSAMGASGGYRQPLVMSRSADQIREEIDDEHGRPTYNIPPVKKPSPHALTELEVAQLEGPDNESRSARIEEFLSPTAQSFGSNESRRNSLLRSTSSAQMRDIKDQMKDLKGKISTLREQARADNLKRRSLQSLRTPSPFTYSQLDQWYTEPPSNRNSIALTAGSASGRNPWNGEESDVEGDVKENSPLSLRDSHADDLTGVSHDIQTQTELALDDHRALDTDDPMHTAREEVSPDESDDVSDMLTENGDVEDEALEDEFQDADEDIRSESGESLYHDTVQHQISHEDREDAFDYEHFFLHSAMGTMSRLKLERRGSVDSYTSEDSVETTRGPTRANDYNNSPSKSLSPRSRRNSSASVSTVDTFATAEEARSRKSPVTPEMGYGSDGVFPGFSRISTSPDRNRSRSVNSVRTKKPSFGASSFHHTSASGTPHSHMGESDASISSIPEEGSEGGLQPQRQSVLRRPMSVSAFSSLHRPSIASLDSQATNRSFPLVPSNKTKRASSSGMLTPRDSPDHDLRSLSESLLSETASVYEQAKAGGEPSVGPRARAASAASVFTAGGLAPQREKAMPLQELLREDKFLVERLVANLGKCVLGLTENGRASMESRQFRRRIEAANRLLEGLGEPPE